MAVPGNICTTQECHDGNRNDGGGEMNMSDRVLRGLDGEQDTERGVGDD